MTARSRSPMRSRAPASIFTPTMRRSRKATTSSWSAAASAGLRRRGIIVVAALPISEASKAGFVALHDRARDPLAGRSVAEKLKVLKTTSYRDYLIRDCACSDEVANCFQGRTLDFFGLGCDAVAAADVRDFGYPGFACLGLP